MGRPRDDDDAEMLVVDDVAANVEVYSVIILHYLPFVYEAARARA